MSRNKPINAAVVVLGDLNRSPRMLNHAKAISSLIHNLGQISLIGYDGGDLRKDIKNDPKITPYFISAGKFINKIPKSLFFISAIFKVIFYLISLTYTLFSIPRPDFVVLQNPPGIPAIFICLVVCFIRRSKLILDWHNYGYTILKVNNRNKLIVCLAYIYEYILGRFATLSLCVSKAMREDLKKLGIKDAIELPDRAMPQVFSNQKLNAKETYELFKKYKETFNVEDYFEIDGKNIKYKSSKPLLLLSSTSWTPDEDFYILLESAKKVDQMISNSDSMTHIMITGRGPLKDKFFEDIKKEKLEHFKFMSVWLDSDDYPKILSAADLGICLHYSSSGYDLPMKVVDMFSAGVPVLAYEYPTIHELVHDNLNGQLFNDSKSLSLLIYNHILCHESGNEEIIEKMREYLKNNFEDQNWISNWSGIVVPALVNKKIKID